MMGQQAIPVIVLKEGAKRERGREAQSNNIAAVKAVADAVRSTLGPRGMDKMLVDSMGDVVITNDGVTILKEMDIEHPAAKMIVEAAKSQDQECGDGTTTAVVLGGELLKKAEELLGQDVHPTVIVNGYKMALEKVRELIPKISFKVDVNDKKTIKDIAITSMGSKMVSRESERLAELAVDAVLAVAEKRPDGKYKVDHENIKIEKKHGGTIADTQLIDGIILDKERVHPRMPKRVEDARIALLECALEIKKTEIEAKIQIRDPSQVQKFLDEEEKTLREMANKIKEVGANVVFCQKGIDDVVQYYLAKEGIFAARRLKKSDMEALAKATNARIVTRIQDITRDDLGKAKLVEEVKVGDSQMTFVRGADAKRAVSILVRGGTEHVVEEVERSLNDAIRVAASVIEDGTALPGGGAPEIELSMRLKEYAASVGGREQMAIEAFASALEVIPRALAENAGLDTINTLIELRSSHKSKGNSAFGVNVFTGKIDDMLKNRVIEPSRVKMHAITAATEVAGMILRIDDIIASKKSEPPAGGAQGGAGAPGGMGGMPGMGGEF
jgi:thermosome